jgi:acetyl esterase/lipase
MYSALIDSARVLLADNMTTDAVYDVQQAIRVVRSHADEWQLDASRIGALGFSAGAELVAASALEFDTNRVASLGGVSSRPDFVGLMWPGPTPFETNESQLDSGASRLHGMSPLSLELEAVPPPTIPDDVPPSFLASAGTGDRIHAVRARRFRSLLERAH